MICTQFYHRCFLIQNQRGCNHSGFKSAAEIFLARKCCVFLSLSIVAWDIFYRAAYCPLHFYMQIYVHIYTLACLDMDTSHQNYCQDDSLSLHNARTDETLIWFERQRGSLLYAPHWSIYVAQALPSFADSEQRNAGRGLETTLSLAKTSGNNLMNVSVHDGKLWHTSWWTQVWRQASS